VNLQNSLSVAGAATLNNSLTVAGSTSLNGRVALTNYRNPGNPGTTEVLSTDANGNLVQIVFPTNTTTFCNRTGAASSCYGPNAEALGIGDTAIGANSRADALLGSTALGAFTSANGNGSTSVGVVSSAAGEGSIAVGFGANTTAEGGSAVGFNARANGFNAQAFGTDAIANGRNVIAIGTASRAQGSNANSIAVGTGAFADGTDVTAIGPGARATGSATTALGVASSAAGNGSIAVGYGANVTAQSGSAIGVNATANGFNAQAFGTGAIANGRNVIAIGTGAVAQGFNTNSLAIGTGSFADGTDVTAIGAGARATGTGSTAIGAAAVTTRNNQLVLGAASTQITAPNLAGPGNAIVETQSDGTLRRGSASVSQITNAVESVGVAVQTAGAMGAALSALPQVSLAEDEPVRCGLGTGGWGSQYAVAGGCAVRVVDRIHLNGALAYAPSVNYTYGSTPSVAGRLGFSFPLGSTNKANKGAGRGTSTDLIAVSNDITKLRSDVKSRDQQIESLKIALDKLLKSQSPVASGTQGFSSATSQLIASLKARIDELEQDKRRSESEDSRQNSMIRDLQEKLSRQEVMFQRFMQQLKSMAPASKPLLDSSFIAEY
jgi:hypothetical protein